MIISFPLGANVSVNGVDTTIPVGGRMSFDDVEVIAKPTLGVQGIATVYRDGKASTMHYDANFLAEKTK